jgi:DNA-binding PadR family transcriptional regulator
MVEALETKTELERVVLAVVAKHGPMTPYAIRKHFAASPAPHFSSSAGTIYPVVERLEQRALLRGRADRRGRQARRQVEATPAGYREAQRWLSELDATALTSPPDPIRSRLYFLGLLPPARRRKLLDAAIQGVGKSLQMLERYVESQRSEGADRFSTLAARGNLHVARARLRWLKEVREEI